MKARVAYPLLFLLPSVMASLVAAVVAAGAGAGVLWLFVYGDSTWPRIADQALMGLAVLVALGTAATLLSAAYSFGKSRESAAGLANRHIALAIAVSVLLPALVLLYEWQVGNLG